jgi:hypothetical protein
VLDAEVTRQREALALQRQQLSRVERVSQRTHSSLYLRRPRVVQELAQKVHRLLRCLDMLAVKLRARSILVGTELALDDGVVLRNLQRRCTALLYIFSCCFYYISYNKSPRGTLRRGQANRL